MLNDAEEQGVKDLKCLLPKGNSIMYYQLFNINLLELEDLIISYF